METVETKLTISVDWSGFYGKQVLNRNAGAVDDITASTDNLPLFHLMFFIWP